MDFRIGGNRPGDTGGFGVLGFKNQQVIPRQGEGDHHQNIGQANQNSNTLNQNYRQSVNPNINSQQIKYSQNTSSQNFTNNSNLNINQKPFSQQKNINFSQNNQNKPQIQSVQKTAQNDLNQQNNNNSYDNGQNLQQNINFNNMNNKQINKNGMQPQQIRQKNYNIKKDGTIIGSKSYQNTYSNQNNINPNYRNNSNSQKRPYTFGINQIQSLNKAQNRNFGFSNHQLQTNSNNNNMRSINLQPQIITHPQSQIKNKAKDDINMITQYTPQNIKNILNVDKKKQKQKQIIKQQNAVNQRYPHQNDQQQKINLNISDKTNQPNKIQSDVKVAYENSKANYDKNLSNESTFLVKENNLNEKFMSEINKVYPRQGLTQNYNKYEDKSNNQQYRYGSQLKQKKLEDQKSKINELFPGNKPIDEGIVENKYGTYHPELLQNIKNSNIQQNPSELKIATSNTTNSNLDKQHHHKKHSQQESQGIVRKKMHHIFAWCKGDTHEDKLPEVSRIPDAQLIDGDMYGWENPYGIRVPKIIFNKNCKKCLGTGASKRTFKNTTVPCVDCYERAGYCKKCYGTGIVFVNNKLCHSCKRGRVLNKKSSSSSQSGNYEKKQTQNI